MAAKLSHRYVSYVHGHNQNPLIGATIGELLTQRVAMHPGKIAVISSKEDITLTFESLLEQSDKLAAALLSVGAKKGDRIGIWAPNCIEWVLTQYATARAGMILVNINPAYQTRELKHVMQKVGIQTIIAAEKFRSQDYYAMLAEICPELESAVPGDINSKRGTFKFKDLMSAATESETKSIFDIQKKLQFDDPINIQFTSGTTGSPKGATLSHHNIVNNSYFVGRTLGYHEKESIVCIPVPLYHCFGMVLGSLTMVTCGTTTVYPSESFQPELALRAVENYRCTALYGTPTMFIDMLATQNMEKYNLTSLHTGMMGGSPCPTEVMKQAVTKLNMRDITVCYGTTENSPITFQTRMDTPIEKRVSTVGKIQPHIEAKVVDREGKILPLNERGELYTRGYAVMLSYWNDDEKTKEVIGEDRWYKTGDIAVLDEEGYCYIVGRNKDMIIRGGENIYPTEIEECLFAHPKIEAAQVFGVPDQRLGEQVCAWIKIRDGEILTEENVKNYCKGQMAQFKVPYYVIFVRDFPMTVTKKVQKFAMREKTIKLLGLE